MSFEDPMIPTDFPPLGAPGCPLTWGDERFDRAYDMCYSEQQRLRRSGHDDLSKTLIHIRVLGWMFHFTPVAQSQMYAELSKSILDCQDTNQLNVLGLTFVDFWIRTFRKYKGKTPSHTSYTAAEPFATIVEETRMQLTPHPKDHSSAKKTALLRDGHRCILTGLYDDTSVAKNSHLRARLLQNPNLGTTTTHLAHIVCESTNLDIMENEKKQDYAATAWAVLKMFGYGEMFKELNGKGVHRLENVMTIDAVMHDFFDTLRLWLEPVSTDPNDHTYTVRFQDPPIQSRRCPRVVSFNNHADRPLPLPSKRYLQLHAACAKVAHMSGAAGYLDSDEWRMEEDGPTLATDGSSSFILNQAILWGINKPSGIPVSVS